MPLHQCEPGQYFNSRTRVGCDPGKINGTITSVYFNSRTREGCDQEQKIYPLQNTLFQLTHPRGVRLHPDNDSWGCHGNFNSRTRVGCDANRRQFLGFRRISTHAPAWGATDNIYMLNPDCVDFNSRTRVGCDSKNKQKILFASVRFLRNSPSKSVYSSNWSILVAIIWSFKYFFSANRPVIICALWARTVNHTIICIPSFSISCFLMTLSVWRRE